MRERPAISVVVPFFNSERTIAACFESLLAQQGVAESYEILLIDNGSTDASASIVAGYDGPTLLAEAAPGAYAARNTGLEKASAPVIAFTDADCVADPDWLRSILEELEDPGVGILVGHCRYPPEASWPLRLLGAYENAKAEYVLGRCEPAYHFGYCNNMAVRASIFEELGPFREWQRAGDTELVHRLASRRPDLKTVYHPAMRVTHLEFVRGRQRARRLRLYTQTNSKIPTFRELSVAQRLGALWLAVRRGAREPG